MTQADERAEGLTGLAETSLGVAFLRDLEHQRADRLFADPFARLFLDAAGDVGASWTNVPSGPSGPAGPGFIDLMADQVAVRTVALDTALLEAAAAGRTQVVLLACGMDARAYRLDWPVGTRVFQVDFAAVLDFRARALRAAGASPRCEVVDVATDLREDWGAALRAAGFDPTARTAWLAEGLVYGLPSVAADGLLHAISALSAPGSTLALDHGEDGELLRAARTAVSPDFTDLWQGGPRTELDVWFRRGGWAPLIRDIGLVAVKYGRPTPKAFDPRRAGTGRGWLIQAVRQPLPAGDVPQGLAGASAP
ncbi:SAM-dependent methyltransferase [Streptomyces buecherae]|uniref:SAM-dependent methyltransferase n=1 Tax=Streptomyces buecherae TaxID=2763006 RepID=UPI001C252A44|nr:SAM-dependent methyltransferase [Streptomyces buecherae]